MKSSASISLGPMCLVSLGRTDNGFEMRITDSNKCLRDILQINPEGHLLKEYLSAESMEQITNSLVTANESCLALRLSNIKVIPPSRDLSPLTFVEVTCFPVSSMGAVRKAKKSEFAEVVLFAGDILDLLAHQMRTLEDMHRFRILADLVPQMLFMATAEGEATYHNLRWEEYTGFSDMESMGDAWRRILHPEDAQRCKQAWENSVKTGQLYQIEYRLRRKDGVFRWHLGRALPMKDGAGRVTGWYGSITDIDDQKNLNESLKKTTSDWQLIIETIPHGIWRTSPDGKADYFSHRFAELVGVDDYDLLGWGWSERIHPEDRPQVLEKWQQARDNRQPIYVEFRYKYRDGTYRWYRSEGNPFFNEKGELTQYFGTWTDIDVIKKKSEELQAAKEAAEAANQAKSAFLANMSHEIRTPLGVILGFADLLHETEDVEEKERYYEIITRNGQSLTRIIDDILDLSKIEAGRLKMERNRFSPRKIILDMLDVFREKTRTIDLRTYFSEDFPEEIESDGVRFRQILINIIGNAVKFTEQGSVTVDSTVERLSPGGGGLHPHGQGRLCIRVQDTGPGIPESQQAELFKPFSQIDPSTTRKFGGTGLGLVLSRRLAQALGGDVKLIESKSGKGSVFEITLVFEYTAVSPDTATRERTAGSISVSTDLSHCKVLVVDDSEDNRKLLERILTLHGAQVDLASDGKEGLHKALMNPYQVVLLDIQMPQMDGYEVMEKLKQQNYRTPVIAVTAHAMEEDRQRALGKGFADYKTKPIHIPDLLATLQRFSQGSFAG